ncbi:hypothetical protein Ciccas_007792 [Cichlidogyrus casuarinus]|uniref:BED-type domain-containing protein n=1 Tax=Cichlidogyrus casuarinus TaxID=1844966 RepID=A0ABD2Q1U7_9PLAT
MSAPPSAKRRNSVVFSSDSNEDRKLKSIRKRFVLNEELTQTKCKYCGKIYAFKTATSVMLRHFKSLHPDMWLIASERAMIYEQDLRDSDFPINRVKQKKELWTLFLEFMCIGAGVKAGCMNSGRRIAQLSDVAVATKSIVRRRITELGLAPDASTHKPDQSVIDYTFKVRISYSRSPPVCLAGDLVC